MVFWAAPDRLESCLIFGEFWGIQAWPEPASFMVFSGVPGPAPARPKVADFLGAAGPWFSISAPIAGNAAKFSTANFEYLTKHLDL